MSEEKRHLKFFYPSEEYYKTLSSKEKNQLLFILGGNLLCTVAFVLLGIVLSMQNLARTGILCMITGLFFIASIILIKKDRLYAGVYLSTIGFLGITLIIVCFSFDSTSGLVYYRNACFIITMGICNQMVALKKRQLWIYYIGALVIFLADTIVKLPSHLVHSTVGTFAAIAINIMAICLMHFVILTLNKFNTKLVDSAHQARKQAQSHLNSISNLISESKNGLEVGERLQTSTESASRSIDELNSIYQGIATDSTGLSAEAATISKTSSQVKMQAVQMKETVQEQNEAIDSTSSAMQEISQNLSSLSNIASSHKSNMDNVVSNLNSQVDLIHKLVNEVEKVQESSDTIATFVNTVDHIASRTGLLAMNASIEAAHAGVTGKGFSVIAQEIRKLSNETAINASKISDGLQENTLIVNETVRSAMEFENYTQKTTEEIKATIAAIEEILAGILSMNEETQKVMNALQMVVEQSKDTGSIVDNVVNEIETQDKTLEKMSEFVDKLHESLGGMENRVNNIKNVINEIESEAVINVEVTKKITSTL